MKNIAFAPLGIVGTSLALGIGGTQISKINPEIGSGILEGGVTSSSFISPAVNIFGAGTVVKQLRDLKNVKKI